MKMRWWWEGARRALRVGVSREKCVSPCGENGREEKEKDRDESCGPCPSCFSLLAAQYPNLMHPAASVSARAIQHHGEGDADGQRVPTKHEKQAHPHLITRDPGPQSDRWGILVVSRRCRHSPYQVPWTERSQVWGRLRTGGGHQPWKLLVCLLR